MKGYGGAAEVVPINLPPVPISLPLGTSQTELGSLLGLGLLRLFLLGQLDSRHHWCFGRGSLGLIVRHLICSGV